LNKELDNEKPLRLHQPLLLATVRENKE
jgi:hypothetical protein